MEEIMPKVKLFKCYDYNEYSISISDELSEGWQEITEEELKYLNSYECRQMISKEYKEAYTYKVLVIEDVTERIPNVIKDIKSFIKKNKDLAAERKEKLEREKANKKRKAEEAKIKRAKKLLEDKGLL